MPQYDYHCPACQRSLVASVSMRDMKTPKINCESCQTPVVWSGLSAPVVGREKRFGVILNDGRRVQGTLNRDAPLRKKR